VHDTLERTMKWRERRDHLNGFPLFYSNNKEQCSNQ